MREIGVRLNKAGKAHEGVLREIGQQKIKRSMRLLQNVMAGLYSGLPHPKGENVSMGTKCK